MIWSQRDWKFTGEREKHAPDDAAGKHGCFLCPEHTDVSVSAVISGSGRAQRGSAVGRPSDAGAGQKKLSKGRMKSSGGAADAFCSRRVAARCHGKKWVGWKAD